MSNLEGFAEEFVVDEDVPLSIWYDSILNVRLKDLNDGDVAKLIRQMIHLHSIIPEALERLKENPVAGYLGDGEVLEAIAKVEKREWDKNPDVCESVSSFIDGFIHLFENNKLNFPEDEERFSNQEREEYYQMLKEIRTTIEKSE
ncbi:contact-dependent growth inhibition system immunity protein [Paenibacillus sp. 19GGS1-52]|uniref:contact-dependent growth inhibition system immunity protein n=1 Tax=Paenibacillus sp. 19GGS1-52 TaxID=2758563 RepID=UPI0023BAA84E|nr:contact-dependent growth inhibition system immunity protein [Paenibacillus sp. 19GGS1-52]